MKALNFKHEKMFMTRTHLMLIIVMLLASINMSAQVGINKDDSAPNANSILHVKGDATSKNIVMEPGTSGGVGIGTTSPGAKLEVVGQVKITGGSPGVNKILTSDANGLATWAAQAPNVGDYGTVTNPVTGKTWLDRNLGASQVATSQTDANAYGDLYQWGRAQDGHEDRSSTKYHSQATSWMADEGTNAWDKKFIYGPHNWLNTTEDDLWTGTSAENNPCPIGFRIPTNAEWNQERLTWSSNNAAGAFGSVLKLPCSGYRDYSDGNIKHNGEDGHYWSSTVNGLYARDIYFYSAYSRVNDDYRGAGFSVRCIED